MRPRFTTRTEGAATFVSEVLQIQHLPNFTRKNHLPLPCFLSLREGH